MMIEASDSAVLAALLDAAVDAIIVSDRDGLILQANSAAAELFRHPPAAMTGRNVSTLMPDDMAARHDGFLHHHISTGQKRIIGIGRDVEGLRGDGSVFPLHLSVGRAEIEGEIVFVAILHDLTRRHAMEQAMARSQRMDAVGRMTGGIAHDFNNLLTVVIGNLELLEMADPDPRAGKLIADALDAAEMGADLTSRLMVFSRKGSLRPEAVDPNEALERAMQLLRRTIAAHCRLETGLSPDISRINVDPTQLQTAILNLALNAQDAMPTGGRILLETREVEIDDSYIAQEIDVATGRYIQLSITDTGEGMSDEARDKALEPFFTTKPSGKGTGLGLSMVYGFVKQSGGYLTLYSEPGRGTTVSLYFPTLQAEAPEAKSKQPGVPEGKGIGQGRLALVVEDDEKVMRLSHARMMALGFDCVTAFNADAAWQILCERDDIELVFTDLMMPGEMSGHGLAQRIAKERPNIRVLMTSGFSEAILRDGQVGPDQPVLRKPYRQIELQAALAAVLKD